ncbi:carbohydrate ABC transporter permease [Cellulosilyticum sp. I15G10I2]|uniref:carbohydrate ABC transporter permease n=1 Tax=Cellulosilyticum sp. I15G10I2 TaxID=1892843 RepID=UPI00085C5347|nr:carbohydrate ABC transporter permease [Cellulosilyticum sp. I15G10I2]
MENHRSKCLPQTIALHIILTLIVIITLAPLIIVLSSSLRSTSNMASPLILFNEFTLESYKVAFLRMNFPVAFMNSVLVTFGSVAVVVMITAMAAYPLARIKSKTAKFLYYFFIAGLIIPAQMVIVPIAQMFNTLGIPNTRFTPMIMFITCSIPFSSFLYTGFMKGIPVEIEEAAYLDGAGLARRFFQIVFPLLKPATISVIITQGIWIWNDYFFPLIFISRSSQNSLPVAMLSFLGDRENPTQWNVLFAACILCAIPLIIVFSLLQKQFVSGVAAGAVKG